ncbi:hypothetical protein [Streptomyces sp. NPDC001269]
MRVPALADQSAQLCLGHVVPEWEAEGGQAPPRPFHRPAGTPSWQRDPGCAQHTASEMSAVADPNTGMEVHDTYNNCGGGSLCDTERQLGLAQGADRWVQVGGTSAASPIIASVYALAGDTSQVANGSYPYSHTSALNDITSGSNGFCGSSHLSTAGPGYDGPTGLGTPNGTGAF